MDGFRSREKSISFLVFGCGMALGLTGLYGYYRSRKEIRSLSRVVENLKQEVEELRSASRRTSEAQFSPLSEKRVNVTFQDEADRASDIASGDEEFFEFTEGDPAGNGDMSQAVKTAWGWLNDPDPETDLEVVFDRIEELCNRFDRPPELLCALTKASNLLVTRAAKIGDAAERKRLAFQTLRLGEEAVSKNSKSADCHKWAAIAIGSVSDFLPTKQKIENGSRFKDHVDIAISLNPSDSTLHHMLGRFSVEIAKLSWIERKVASTLFAEVPLLTMEDALKHFENAYELRREWKENILHLAKSCIELKHWDSARVYVDEGLGLPIIGEDDEVAHNELLLLKKSHFNK